MTRDILDNPDKLAEKIRNLGGNDEWTAKAFQVITHALEGKSLTEDEIVVFNTFLAQLRPEGF